MAYYGLMIGNNLFQFVTDVKMGASSKVARRPVINRAEGEEIDIGMWTFSPIEMTAILRANDNGKAVLENWFDADVISTAYLVSESGYWKLEDLWFKEKKCTHEESTEYELYDRKWKFEIILVITTATFVPSGEIVCPIGNQIYNPNFTIYEGNGIGDYFTGWNGLNAGAINSGEANINPSDEYEAYIEQTLATLKQNVPVICLTTASFEIADWRCFNRGAWVEVTYTDDTTTRYDFNCDGYSWKSINFLSLLETGKVIKSIKIGIVALQTYGDGSVIVRNVQLTSGGTTLY